MHYIALTALVAVLALPSAVALADSEDTIASLAVEANVDQVALEGALNAQPGVDGREYLIFDGKLDAPTTGVVSAGASHQLAPGSGLREYAYANHPDVARCIEQIVNVESNGWYTGGWNPIAIGRGEHASGLGGFLPSTWASTPQGRAGLSIWDGAAQVEAIAWMLKVGRGREFAAYAWGRCG